MPKWWPFKRGETDSVSPAQPPHEAETSLPDPADAREALAEAQEGTKRTEDLGREVREMLAVIRSAREENNFAEGIVEMIRKGR